jgi:hypothetical protein
MKKLLLFLLCFFLMNLAFSQVNLPEFNKERLNTNQKAMLVLGAWAAGNMLAGGILSGRATGPDKYFHRMNALWNVVNLGLAGVGYFAAWNSDPGSFGLGASFREQAAAEKIFLVNAALDIAYIAGGAYLIERSKNVLKRADMLKGFGRSIILQGAFLFIFDGVLFGIHHHHGKSLYRQADKVQITATGNSLGLIIKF